MEEQSPPPLSGFPKFERKFFDSGELFTCIGSGEIGGKAQGLAFAKGILEKKFSHDQFPGVSVKIPTMTVLTTAVFDSFLRRNNLTERLKDVESDDQIARLFLQAEFPPEYTGDLMALITKVKTPLAIRSSSLLEDAMFRSFAGVYATKMIPNNEPESQTRFKRLIDAVKFVYASTFFTEARTYVEHAGQSTANEKMVVIIQEVLGRRHFNRFYPNLSAVARSYNYYPVGRSKPEDGVVDLALGLGMTIVDGGIVWTYSPASPKIGPPPLVPHPRCLKALKRNSGQSIWENCPDSIPPVRRNIWFIFH